MANKKVKGKQNQAEVDFDISKEAINLVTSEFRAYDRALIFVTDKVAFDVRNLLRTLRKNYWGVFDNEYDKVTNTKMTWVPLTEFMCDTWVKNSDRDAEDLKVKSKKIAYMGLTSLVRSLLKNWMGKNIFGEILDETEREMAINGSTIWKIFKGYDENGKPTPIRLNVDILNAYFDFTSKSIQDAPRFTERSLMMPDDVKAMDGWMNTDKVIGQFGLHPTDTNLTATTTSGGTQTVKLVDVWETWGRIPKSLLTGKLSDANKMVDGHIVASGIQGGGNPLVHLIETNPGGLKPYEEGHTKKIPGRWLGRGPAESVMMIQGWVNMIVNIRKIRASVSQLGIFKLKKGTISPQNLSRMASNGVIQVNDMDDIQQLVMQEASVGSYKDEDNAVSWATRVTSSYEAVTGEAAPAGKTATGILAERQASASTFAMSKKAIGFFLTRVMNRHMIPILTEMLTPGEIIRVSGSPEELMQYDEAVINCLAKEELAKGADEGKVYDNNQVLAEIEKAKKHYRSMGKERLMALKKINLTDYDIEFYTDDEKFDAQAVATNLASILKVVPEYKDVVIRELFDIMGLDSSKIPSDVPPPEAPKPALTGGIPQGGGMPAPQEIAAAAGVEQPGPEAVPVY